MVTPGGCGPPQHRAKKGRPTRVENREWNSEVEKFRVSLQDAEASDEAVQAAWSRLRKSYRNAFNAVAYPVGPNENLEPFPFWAAENIEEGILERILRVEFSSSLASCTLSRLKVVASMADLSIYTLILYFGNSFFPRHRLLALRRRVQIFKRSATDTWPFTEGYKRMLCEAAGVNNKAPLDTTDIPWRGMPPLFTERVLNILAPENPEFERKAEKEEQEASGSSETSLSGIPLSKKLVSASSQSLASDSVTGVAARDARGSEQSMVEDSNGNAPKRPAVQKAAQSQISQDDHLFSLRPTHPSHQHRSARNCNSVLPSIEFDAFVSEAPTSATGTKGSSTPGSSDSFTLASKSAANSHEIERKTSSRKRPIKEEFEDVSEENPCKRVDATSSKANLLLEAKDWDDETVVIIMKQLAAIRPRELVVVNCLEVEPGQIFQKGEKQQILLIPFKLDNGQRLLAVVTLISITDIGGAGKLGYIQYLNPGCRKGDEHKELARIAVKFLHLLGKILPGYDTSPEKWHFYQNYPCPDQFVNGNGGLALCLLAMCVVGGPLKAPLAAETDWMFWRHIILSVFWPQDTSVQLRTKKYLKEIVDRQVRQGQLMDFNLYSRERSGDELQVSRQVTVSPRDRLCQRGIYAQGLLQTAQEAVHILNNLTDHVYDARISVKISIEMAKLQREEQHGTPAIIVKSLSGSITDNFQPNEMHRADGAELEEIEASIQFFKARLDKVYELHQCLKKGRDLISHFRRDIGDAVTVGYEDTQEKSGREK